jgi:hypothetical protein
MDLRGAVVEFLLPRQIDGIVQWDGECTSIEHAIQEWVSSGAVAHWINWHALKSADEKTVVLD